MRRTPCESTPRRLAQMRTSATVRACSAAIPARANSSRTKTRRSSGATTTTAAAGGAGGPLTPGTSSCRQGKVLLEPVAHEVDDEGVLLREHEMVDAGHQV